MRILAEDSRNGVRHVGATRGVGAKAPTAISSDAGDLSRVTQPTGHRTDPRLHDAPNVIGYIRVSTDKQADEGLSLDAQRARIQGMAMAQGISLADVIVDAGVSAKSLDRPGMARLLSLVDAGAVQTILVAKLDRLTRSVGDLIALLERFTRRDVALVSVAESLDTRSSSGRLVLHIMGSVSQWEREAIGERTREALRYKRAKGERVGTLPFGAQLAADGVHHPKRCKTASCPGCVHLEPAPVEQRLLARMRALRADGWTTRQIAADLNAGGAKTRRGTALRFQYVARALKVSA